MTTPLAAKVRALIPNDQRGQIKWLYEALSVLDSKAQGLLRLNAFVLAIGGFSITFVKYSSLAGYHPFIVPFYLICVMDFLALVISCLLCFWIIRMSWGFLETLPDAPTAAELDSEVDNHATVTDERTLLFQWSWRLSVAGFVSTVMLDLLGGVVAVLYP
jgi:hypothetical protein